MVPAAGGCGRAVRRGVLLTKATQVIVGTFKFCHGEHRGQAHVGGIVGRESEAVFGSIEREAVLPGHERACGDGGKPAHIGPLAKPVREFPRIDIAGGGDHLLEVRLYLSPVVDEVAHIGVVRFGFHRREHALGVPVTGVELACLA